MQKHVKRIDIRAVFILRNDPVSELIQDLDADDAIKLLEGGFSGNGGTPLLSANEIEWLTPQSEYRPTEYIQGWMKFWFEEDKRLKVAKNFQQFRIEYLKKVWSSDRDLQNEG